MVLKLCKAAQTKKELVYLKKRKGLKTNSGLLALRSRKIKGLKIL